MAADFARFIDDVAGFGGIGIDWAADGPWLAMLLCLLTGIGLPSGLYALFDGWAARRVRIDTIALATRYGGFMNSWAVFGRHASEYRDLRPLFPEAQAAELARFPDGTACIAARFRTATAAGQAAEQRFASFAAAGVEYGDAAVSFQTGHDGSGGNPKGYARGQWLLIGDTLFAFYGADSGALAKRRRSIPALRARRFPGPLRLLHSRGGHAAVAALWVALHILLAGALLERSAFRAASLPPLDPGELRDSLVALDSGRPRLAVELRRGSDGVGLAISGHAEDLRQQDLARLAGRDWLTGLDLGFDRERSIVTVLPLVGRSGAPPRLGEPPPPPDRWRNNPLLIEPGDPVLAAVRTAVLEAGWGWQPVLWPALPRF